jgi:hypothetical protein
MEALPGNGMGWERHGLASSLKQERQPDPLHNHNDKGRGR